MKNYTIKIDVPMPDEADDDDMIALLDLIEMKALRLDPASRLADALTEGTVYATSVILERNGIVIDAR